MRLARPAAFRLSSTATALRPIVAILLTTVGTAKPATVGNAVEERLSRAETRGTVVGFEPDKAGVTIDGDLSDWVPPPDGWALLQQDLDKTEFGINPRPRDAAAIKLTRGTDAIYVAIRVVDDSVLGADAVDKESAADFVVVTLDVRPIASGRWGDSVTSDGFYRLRIHVPNVAGGKLRWDQTNADERPIGPIDVEGRKLADGYTVEAKIPVTSLSLGNAPSLDRPIGFDLTVIDADRRDGIDAMQAYSWAQTLWAAAPDELGVAAPGFRLRCPEPYLRVVPTKLVDRRPEPSMAVHSAVFTRLGSPSTVGVQSLSARHETSSFDRPPGAKAVPPVMPASETEVVIDYPALGVSYRSRAIVIEKIEGGRYEFVSKISGLPKPETTLRAYGMTAGSVGLPFGRLMFGSALLAQSINVPAVDPISGLAGSEFILELNRYEATPSDSVAGTVKWLTSPDVYFAMSEEAAMRGVDPAFLIEIAAVRRDDEQTIHRVRIPLRLYGGERSFTIATPGSLRAGKYRVETRVMAFGADPSVVTTPADLYSGQTNGGFPSVPLTIAESPRPPIATTVVDAERLLTKATFLGNPALDSFPEDNPRDAFARTVYDMQLYRGRIYFSCGDIDRNRGPVPIWSFAPTDAGFVKEFVTDDDAIECLRVYGDTLYAPGTDGAGAQSWALGNLYAKKNGIWTKLRTVPNGIHVFDAAEWQGKLFTVTGTLKGAGFHESSDGGRTWDSRHVARVTRFRQVAASPDDRSLLIIPEWGKLGPYRFNGKSLEHLEFDLFPGVELNSPQSANHLAPFLSGFVYCIGLGYYPLSFDRPRPLIALQNLEEGPAVVSLFKDAVATDLIVRDGTCHVLTAKPDGNEFLGEIYSSTDLRAWTHRARFTVPAIPYSFEIAEDGWFVGLGARDRSARKDRDPASGGVYRIQ
jgi:hypothetical protein